LTYSLLCGFGSFSGEEATTSGMIIGDDVDGWNILLHIRRIKIMSMTDCCIGTMIDA